MGRKKTSHHVAPAAVAAENVREEHDHDYSALLDYVQRSFDKRARGEKNLFEVATTGLFDTYLEFLPGERQLHNCHACRRFIDRYGGLVSIDEQTGVTTPVMWDPSDVPSFYRSAFIELNRVVGLRPILGAFRTNEPVWGDPVTGNWRHISVKPPRTLVHSERAQTPHQASADVAHRVENVEHALTEFPKKLLETALKVLQSDTLSRADKYVSPVQWLIDLHTRPKKSLRLAKNVLWARVAAAPEGFSHPRSSVIGTLLEDIERGSTFEDVKRRWEEKVHPAQLGRPQAPPKAGNVRASEDLVRKLGIQPSLARRHATLVEVPKLWTPSKAKAAKKPTGGIFAGVLAKAPPTREKLSGIEAAMTWAKFSKTVLPGAEQMQVNLPTKDNLVALTAATDENAPPIFKWDRPEQRNHFSFYTYTKSVPVVEWSLAPGWHDVAGVTLLPNTWGDKPMTEIFEGAVFLIEGARDRNYATAGLGLFPELLKNDLHEARATIEAFSNGSVLSTTSAPLAQGVDFRKTPAGKERTVLVRVLRAGTWDMYKLDRWE